MLFCKIGGICQLAVDSDEGLAVIDKLDPALWAVTSAPVADLCCDPAFLAFLDAEGSGRIRMDQVIAARDWLFRMLTQRSRLRDKSDVLRLADVAAGHEEGLAVIRAAEQVLAQTAATDRSCITLAQVRAFRADPAPGAGAASVAAAADAPAVVDPASLVALERLLLYHRWILELASHFVNLSALLAPGPRALIGQGTLVLDGRRLELAVRVADRASHRSQAAGSRLFIVYAAIADGAGKATSYEVAAPVVGGDRGRLVVGKRGLFIARDGTISEAQIVDTIDHPISVLDGLRTPWRWLSLCRRDLAVLLEANGWAVNRRLPLTKKLCRQLNRRPVLPLAAGAATADAQAVLASAPEGRGDVCWRGVLILASIVIILLAAWGAVAVWSHAQTISEDLRQSVRPQVTKPLLPPVGKAPAVPPAPAPAPAVPAK